MYEKNRWVVRGMHAAESAYISLSTIHSSLPLDSHDASVQFRKEVLICIATSEGISLTFLERYLAATVIAGNSTSESRI